MSWNLLSGTMLTSYKWFLFSFTVLYFTLQPTAAEFSSSKDQQPSQGHLFQNELQLFDQTKGYQTADVLSPSNNNAQEGHQNYRNVIGDDGSKPNAPSDFQCRIFNNEYAVCKFKVLNDCSRTTYQLTPLDGKSWIVDDVVPEFKGFNSTCANKLDVFTYKFHKLVKNPDNLRLKLIATSIVDGTRSVQFEKIYTIDAFENEIPGAPKIVTQGIGTNGVNLSWVESTGSHYEQGISHEIDVIRFENSNEVHYVDNINIIGKKAEKRYYLPLPYPFYNYSIRLRLKSNRARKDKDMWSKSDYISITTLPTFPYKPPQTTSNSFQIIENTARLYWQNMAPYERNGRNFRYSIHREGEPPIITEETSCEIPIERNKVYSIYIKSRNEMGESKAAEHIEVNTFAGPRPLNVLSSLDGNIYRLTWTHFPSDGQVVTKYTVFWCKEETAKRQCKGDFDFEDVPIESTTYSKMVKDGERLLLGVSGYYGNFSAGIQWQQTRRAKRSSKQLMAPRDLKVEDETTSKSATLSWSPPDSSDCLITGYDLILVSRVILSQGPCLKKGPIFINESLEYRPILYTLKNLCSSSQYNISVVAKCDKLDSEPSNLVVFWTLALMNDYLEGSDINFTCPVPDIRDIRDYNIKTMDRQLFYTWDQLQQVEIANETHLVLHIPKAEKQKRQYQCSKNTDLIRTVDINVGTKPQPPLDFQCREHNNAKAFCNFTVETNNIKTKYVLHALDGDIWESVSNTSSSGFNETCKCNVTIYNYTFKKINIGSVALRLQLNASNMINDKKFKWSKDFSLNTTENEIPGAPKIVTQGIGTNGVNLSWVESTGSHYEQGISHEIDVIPFENSNEVHYVDNINIIGKKAEKRYYLPLPYPFYKYSIRLRLKSNRARKDKDMWSKSDYISITTLPTFPYKPPQTTSNSFQIIENTARLYWQNMAPYERNGRNFRYSIHREGEPPIITEETSCEIPIERNKVYSIYIKSRNEMGESKVAEHIEVNTFAGPRPLNVLSSLNSNIYRLTWTHFPSHGQIVTKYTVFWCREETAKRQCKGDFDFEDVPIESTTYSKMVKDGERLLLGVAGYYRNFSAGIQWAQCNEDISSELSAPNLIIKSSDSTSLNITWSHNNCDSIVENYTLSYRSDIMDEPITLKRKNLEKNAILTNLTPCTNYMITFTMFSLQKHKTVYRSKTTDGSAPREPHDLHEESNLATSKSTKISWLPPQPTSCNVTGYAIKLISKEPRLTENCVTNVTLDVNPKVQENGRLSHTLENLCSYTEYHVSVAAKHDKLSSKPSSRVSFWTLIGKPEKPSGLNYYHKEKVFNWSMPIRKLGPKIYYIVDLVIVPEDTVISRSAVKENSCHLDRNLCDFNESLIMRVRTISLPTKMDKIDLSYLANNQKMNQIAIDNEICSESLKDFNDFPLQYITSDYKDTQEIPCFNMPDTLLASWLICLGAMIVIFVVMIFAKWFKNRYIEMKSIGLELPEGLKYDRPMDFKSEDHYGAESPDLIGEKDGDFFRIKTNKITISSTFGNNKFISRSDSETADTHSVDSSDPLNLSITSDYKPEKTLSKGYQSGSLLETPNSTENFTFDYSSSFPLEAMPNADNAVMPNQVGQSISGYVAVENLGNLKTASTVNPPTSTNSNNNESKDMDSSYMHNGHNGFHDPNDSDSPHVTPEKEKQIPIHPNIDNLKNCYVSNGMFGPMTTPNFHYYNNPQSDQNTVMENPVVPNQFSSSYVTVDEITSKKNPPDPKPGLKNTTKNGELKSPLIFLQNDETNERQLPSIANIYTTVGSVNNFNLNYVTQKDLVAMAQNM